MAAREASNAVNDRSLGRFGPLASCIRFEEVLVLQGPPLLGAVLSMGKVTTTGIASLLMLAAGSCLLVAHVFVLNDWSGMHADLRNPRRAISVFSTRGIGRTDVRNLSVALLALSLLVLAPLGSPTLFIALLIAGLSALYSGPGAQVKGIPLVSSALHLAGGFLHFLMGYSAFRALDGRGLAVGCFVGLVFTAGHLTHEVRDADGDRESGIRTNAVAFGKARTFVAGLVLFAIADVLLVGLAASGIVPRSVTLVAALYPFHLHWSLRALREGLTFRRVRCLQIRYRVLYAAVGVIVFVTALGGF